MPRFVLLEHDHPGLHWDFMLEREGSLRTWRLSEPPRAGAIVNAEAIADHRLAYLDYEGSVSGGRGTVRRWDGGKYELVDERSDRWEVELRGTRVRGTVVLERKSPGEAWTLQFFPI